MRMKVFYLLLQLNRLENLLRNFFAVLFCVACELQHEIWWII